MLHKTKRGDDEPHHHVKWWDSLQGARPAVTIDCALNRWAIPLSTTDWVESTQKKRNHLHLSFFSDEGMNDNSSSARKPFLLLLCVYLVSFFLCVSINSIHREKREGRNRCWLWRLFTPCSIVMMEVMIQRVSCRKKKKEQKKNYFRQEGQRSIGPCWSSVDPSGEPYWPASALWPMTIFCI